MKRIPATWREHPVPYERDDSIQAVIRSFANRRPEAIALESGDRQVTYRQLATASTRMAAVLRRYGVHPEMPVGLALPRSIELVQTILAVLEAGGWYVPLDTSLPTNRLAYLTSDCRAPVIVTWSEADSAALEAAGVEADRLIDLGSLLAEADSEPNATELNDGHALQLAYAMYTSGSTGQPKGVAITHRGVLRLVRNVDYLSPQPGETFLLLAPPAFDASTLEMWGALLNGGRLVVHPEERPSLDGVGEIVERAGITTLFLTTGLFHQVIETQIPRLQGLRRLMTGGDVASPDLVRRVFAELPGKVLVNAYGPTENTTITTCHIMANAGYDVTTDIRRSVPIGRCINNTTVRIVDAEMRQLPVGDVGELATGGDGLARGYLGRPALTAEFFVPDPYSDRPGARLYRTGDRVAFREDGVLLFRGRVDDQVKIRGFRMHPGEITHMLLTHPAVEQAVTVLHIVQAAGAEDKRLATYFVGTAGATADELEPAILRPWLSERLPAYMVPAAIVRLDAMPLTSNSKVDRKALPAPSWGAVGGTGGLAATETEARLVALFADALGVETVATDDDFFASGGHSLLATRLVAKSREAFEVELSMGDLYRHPRVTEMARLVVARRTENSGDNQALRPIERGAGLELSFAQRRLWFHHQLHPAGGLYNIPLALDIRGPLDTDALARAIGALVDRHEPLRTRYPEIDDLPMQVIEPPTGNPWYVVRDDLSALAHDKHRQALNDLCQREITAPFDLAKGPVMRARLVRLGADHHRFLLTVHHIAFDGWSVDVLLRELETLYGGGCLEPLEVQYADFAAWQALHFADTGPQAPLGLNLEFWRDHLADAPLTLNLAPDHARPSTPLLAGDTLQLRIEPAAMAALRRLVHEEAATPFLGLMAIYQGLLHQHTGENRFLVGTPSSGRDHPATQAMSGFFVNLTPMLADFTATPSLRQLIRQTRDEARAVFEFRDLPFERLVEELAPSREASRHPLVQAVLSLETALFGPPSLAGLEVERLRMTTGTAKFDLLLYAEETADGGLDAWFEYPVELFQRSTIQTLADQLRRAVDQWVARPDRPIIAANAAPRAATGPATRQHERPEPTSAETASPDFAGPPRGATEVLVAGVFATILGLEAAPDRAESFFELGGHSLLATQMAARLRRACEVELPIGAVFEHASVASLSAYIEAERRAGSRLATAILEADPSRDPAALPVSFAQERLWFLDRFDPGSPVYNIPEVLDLEGPIDGAALARAALDLVARHRALQGRFRMHGKQLVHDATKPGGGTDGSSPGIVQHLDLSTETDAIAAAERLTVEASTIPIELDRGPLLRVLVMRLSEDHHRLVWVIHHAVFDGWSLGILHRDLAAAYRQRRAGLEAELPALAISYADYADWQRRATTDAVLEPQLDFWRSHLAGAPPALELPTDRPRPPRQSTAGANVHFRLDNELAMAIDDFARNFSATPFMVLLAAFEITLQRHTGQTDLVVGTPVAGRAEQATEDLIGLFVNTLPLRLDLAGRPSFAEVVARVRSAALGAYDHQDVPFERLVDVLEPERSLARSPIFQVLFALANTLPPKAEIDGVTVRRLPPSNASAKFDLSLLLEPDANGLAGTFEYATALFDAITIERFAARFVDLLRAGLTAPDSPAATLPLLGPGDLDQLAAWNATGSVTDLPTGPTTLQGLFAQCAARLPEAPAVVWSSASGDGSWTYAELKCRASRLAHHLRDLGVSPEDRVGICLQRNGDLLPSILAVLFVGGTYVPLDPVYPEKRLAFMQDDAGLRVLITHDHVATSPTVREGVFRLAVDQKSSWWGDPDDRRRDSPPAVSVEPSQLAYLIYTSGSTGRAKGVAIEHRQAVSMVRWGEETFGPSAVTGMVAATSVCFDLSIFELFLPLATGGTVLLVRDALALLDLPAAVAERATLVNTVPSVMAEVLRVGDDLPPTVRVVNLAGEPLPGRLVDELYDRGVEAVWNLYGPSEDTTYSTAAPIPRGAAMPSIGRPIRGTRAHLLDVHGLPVPPGTDGELYLAGEGVSRGYLGRPALTAERYLPNPFGNQPGARLYRTGDRARWRADGELSFLGRLDHQIKIRGFRIELGEIESALNRHSEVAEAVVLAPADGDDATYERRLIAWVVAAPATLEAPSGDSLSSRLRAHLADHLPAYLVPSTVVELEALPRLPNGKIDRKQLEVPPRGLETDVTSRPAESALEIRLAKLWAAELGLDYEQVGVDDDFFASGGHSLAAIRLLASVGDELLIDDPPAVYKFFEQPTVSGLRRMLQDRPDHRRIERAAELLIEMDGMDEAPAAAPTGSKSTSDSIGRSDLTDS